MIAIASIFLISSIRWAPTNIIFQGFSSSPTMGTFVLIALSLVVGRWWIGRRLAQYREDRITYSRFDTPRDTRIVFWQKFSVLLLCGIILPLVAMFVTFGTQVFTRAFDLN